MSQIPDCSTAYIIYLEESLSNELGQLIKLMKDGVTNKNVIALKKDITYLSSYIYYIDKLLQSNADKKITLELKNYDRAEGVGNSFMKFDSDKSALYCHVEGGQNVDSISGSSSIPVYTFLLNNFVSKKTKDIAGLKIPKLVITSDHDGNKDVVTKPQHVLGYFTMKEESEKIPFNKQSATKYKEVFQDKHLKPWKDIVKATMEHYSKECNELKNTPKEFVMLACAEYAYPGSMDYMTSLLNCHQIYSLSQDADICPAENIPDMTFDL